MLPCEVRLRAAEAADAECLSALARQVFLDTYATSGIRLALAREAEAHFSVEAMRQRLADASRHTTLAEWQGHLIAFAEIAPGAGHPMLASPDAAELSRLYVQSPFLRRGLGRLLLQHAEAAALAQAASTLWLTAWAGNERALAFYTSQGYEELGSTEYAFEGEAFENRLFAKTLRPARMPPVTMSPAVSAFWDGFEASRGGNQRARLYEVFHFADSEAAADALAELVLNGTKRATAGLVWSFESAGQGLLQAGDLSIVTNWAGAPVCVVETIAVDVVPFEDVSAEFAAVEGEGDGSLAYWREAHWAYFGRECARIGKQPGVRMPVACERFEVIHRA